MPYVALINVPGYLPMDDDPPTFDTSSEAWSHLAFERQRDEDNALMADVPVDDPGGDYSETYYRLRESVTIARWSGPLIDTVYGPTPGYEGDHDLGLAYSVQVLEESAYREQD